MINNIAEFFIVSDIGFALLLAACIADLAIPFLLAPFCRKYDHLTMVMSLLGNRNYPVHSVYNLWLVTAGFMFVLGSIKLYTVYSPVSHILSLWLFSGILLYAAGACVLSGIFSVGETKELASLSEKMHGYGSVSGFIALAFVPLVIGILSIRSGDFSSGIAALFFFILAILFFSLFVMADKEKFANTIVSNEGLWQRLSLLCMYAPIIMISYRNLLQK